MKMRINKTTIGSYNRGACGSNNNCRYKGVSPCWEVINAEGPYQGDSFWAFKRKADATAFAKYAERFTPEEMNAGDRVSMYESETGEELNEA